LSPTESHDEFLELCVVATSDQLTEEEQKRLQEHVAVCPPCHEALQQYEAVVGQAIPAIATAMSLRGQNPDPPGHRKRLRGRFSSAWRRRKDKRTTSSAVQAVFLPRPTAPHRLLFSNTLDWRNL
jgi:hypothetical protein